MIETEIGCIGAELHQQEETSQQPQGMLRGCQWLRGCPLKAPRRTLSISLTCPVLLIALSYNRPLKVSSRTSYTS